MELSTQLIAQRSAFASAAEKEHLRLGACKRVFRFTRVRYEDGRPHSFERIVLPLARLPGLDRQFASTKSIVEIADRYGLKLGASIERITKLSPPPEVAAQLLLGGDQLVIELDRVTSSADGVPIEWRVIFMLP